MMLTVVRNAHIWISFLTQQFPQIWASREECLQLNTPLMRHSVASATHNASDVSIFGVISRRSVKLHLETKKNRGWAGHCLWPISMCVYKIWTKHLKYTNNTATENSDCHVMKTYSKMLISNFQVNLSQSEAQAL